jgi:DNA ligase-associated metallophosphoesterase
LAEGRATLRIAATLVSALPEGALWVESERTLIVSDMHLEKGAAFARKGQMLPPYDTRTTLARLQSLIVRLKPANVIALGDSFHDKHGPAYIAEEDAAQLKTLTSVCDWLWILGNHDPELPSWLGGARAESMRLGDLALRHEPSKSAAPGEIAGHLHPCAKIVGRGRSVRRRCFATDGARLVMPAFGAFTGGLNLRDAAFAPLFPFGLMALAMARDRVLPAPQERLLFD